MGFSIRCPACQAKLKAKNDKVLGKRLPCPKCQQVFVVQEVLSDEPASAPTRSKPAASDDEMNALGLEDLGGPAFDELDELPLEPLPVSEPARSVRPTAAQPASRAKPSGSGKSGAKGAKKKAKASEGDNQKLLIIGGAVGGGVLVVALLIFVIIQMSSGPATTASNDAASNNPDGATGTSGPANAPPAAPPNTGLADSGPGNTIPSNAGPNSNSAASTSASGPPAVAGAANSGPVSAYDPALDTGENLESAAMLAELRALMIELRQARSPGRSLEEIQEQIEYQAPHEVARSQAVFPDFCRVTKAREQALLAGTPNPQAQERIRLMKVTLPQIGLQSPNEIAPFFDDRAISAASPLRQEVVAHILAALWRQQVAGMPESPLSPENWQRLVHVESTVFGAESLLTAGAGGANQAPLGVRCAIAARQVGLAFHNFADTYKAFPRPNSLPQGNSGNLSWRVWLLPYLDEQELYAEFKLNEPWDSPHNRALIPRMPDIYRTLDGGQPGQTTLHVFTGPHAPFDPNKAVALRDITDGTTNTLLCVVAGAELASEWTRPGGIEFDPARGLAQLGTPPVDNAFPVTFMDGAGRLLPSQVAPTDFANLVNHRDGNAPTMIEYQTLAAGAPSQIRRLQAHLRTLQAGGAANNFAANRDGHVGGTSDELSSANDAARDVEPAPSSDLVAARLVVDGGYASCVFTQGGEQRFGSVEGDVIRVYDMYGGGEFSAPELAAVLATLKLVEDPAGNAPAWKIQRQSLANTLFHRKLCGEWNYSSTTVDGRVAAELPMTLTLAPDGTYQLVYEKAREKGQWHQNQQGQVVFAAPGQPPRAAAYRFPAEEELALEFEQDGKKLTRQFHRAAQDPVE